MRTPTIRLPRRVVPRRVLPGAVLLASWSLITGAAPETTGDAPLPLRDVLAVVASRGPQVLAAEARAAAARRAARSEPRWANPTLDLRLENWRPGAQSFEAGRDLDLFAVVSQPLDLSGRLHARRQAAGAEAGATEAEAARVRRAALAEAARGYFDVLRARALRDDLVDQRDGLRELVGVLRRRVAEGYSAEADLEKFRSEAGRGEAYLARAESDLERARLELGALYGEAVDAARLREPESLDPTPEPDPAAIAADAPELRAAQARAAAAQSTLAFERARGRLEPELAAGWKKTGGADTVVAGLVLPLPLADRNAAAVARAQGEARAAELELESVRRRAQAVAAARVERARRLAQTAEALRNELEAPAAVVRRAARSAFREGAFDVLRVVDAERAWVEARRDALELRSEAFLAAFELRLSLGLEDRP